MLVTKSLLSHNKIVKSFTYSFVFVSLDKGRRIKEHWLEKGDEDGGNGFGDAQ